MSPTRVLSPRSIHGFAHTVQGRISALIMGVFLVAGAVGGASAGTLFGEPVSYPTGGSYTIAVAVGDLNADGKLDLVTTTSAQMSVLLGNGDGTFQPYTSYFAGNSPSFVVIADVNRDGKQDIAVTTSDGLVVIFAGEGDGTFSRLTQVGTEGSLAAAVGDLNADGSPDLVTTNTSSVSVFRGNGDGTFQAKVNFATGLSPRAVLIGDLNADGKPDLVTVSQISHSVSILLGNGDTTFQPKVDLEMPHGPNSLAINDVSDDGKPDLVTANFFGFVSVRLGNGDGTFGARMEYGTGGPLSSVAVADLDRDENPDLVASDMSSANAVSVLLGSGGGAFVPAGNYATGNRPPDIAVGDLNADGKPDLATTDAGFGTISVLLNIVSRAPLVAAPAAETVTENTELSFSVAAVDPDGEGIASLTAAPLPTGATFTPNDSNTSGTFVWTPSYTQAGSYSVTFTASNSLSGLATTAITVTNVDDPPTVTGPVSVTGDEGTLVMFSVSASDPNGDPITSLMAAPLPPGASFDVGPTNTSGTFSWTPDFAQAGTYSVTISAESAHRPDGVSGPVTYLTGTHVVQVNVSNADRPPVLVTPGAQTALEGVLLTFGVSALDPDGDEIMSLTAAPLPSGATFAPSAARTAGTFSWTPDFGQAGSYSIAFTASNALSTSGTVPIQVSRGNRPPAISAPAGVYASEGALVTFSVSAVDPDGDRVVLGVEGLPVGATFVDSGNGTGAFSWVAGYYQSGTFMVAFTARDALGTFGTPAITAIVVADVNRAPTAAPGGPYAGVVNVPIAFNGGASSDPDGDVLAYMWTFGDGASATGPFPLHGYSAGGSFLVTLTVSDGTLSSSTPTSTTIQDVFPGRAFTTSANSTIRLGSGKATWCAQIEPVGGSYLNTAVIPATIAMKYGTGQIYAQSGKTSIGSDKDANGVAELTACFAKTDLRTLFAGLPKGANTVTVTLEGDLTTGGKFRGTLTVDVVSSGPGLVASLSPNPPSPEAILTFATTKPGGVLVRLFDLQGRLVRALSAGHHQPAGYHDVRVDGRDDRGSRLPSGVYFYRVETEEGTVTGRFVIAR